MDAWMFRALSEEKCICLKKKDSRQKKGQIPFLPPSITTVFCLCWLSSYFLFYYVRGIL